MAIINSELLVIEEYADWYSGCTKINRLLFIEERCPKPSMQLAALKVAYDEIKTGEDTKLFKEVVQKINGRLGPDYGLDMRWIEAMDYKSELTKEKLEKTINDYLKKSERADGIKEISWCRDELRIAYNDFGNFHYARGALGDAFYNYECSNKYGDGGPSHYLGLYLNLILVSIDMGNFTSVLKCVDKVTQRKNLLPNRTTLVKLQFAAGLAHLEHKQYKLSAKKFVEAPIFLDCYSEVIASPDVAIYGGLCALASFDRVELKANVIDNMKFNKYLDLVPKVREPINDFYSRCYASCLDKLEYLKPALLLDIHLHDHVEILYTRIRKKALIQYTLPYISRDMNLMAITFKTTVAELQKELETLIPENQIQVNINSVNKVLYACPVIRGTQLSDNAILHRFNLIKSKYDKRA